MQKHMGGWKTWAAGIGLAVFGIGGGLLGIHEMDTGIKMALEGLAIVGIGHKIEKANR